MQSERTAYIIVLIVVLIGFIGQSLAYPILPPLFLHPEQRGIVPISWHQSLRGLMLGVTLAAYPFGQFLGSSVLGGLSDRYGRKYLLIISLLGTSLFYLLTAISIDEYWLGMLILARFMTGCLEGSISIARAIAVDLTTINKNKAFGMISAMSSIGYLIGPLIGGLLADKQLVSWFNYSLPFYAAMIMSLLAALVAAFYLRETLQTPNLQLKLLQHFNLWQRVKRFSKNRLLILLFAASAFYYLGVDTYYEFFTVYLVVTWHMTPAILAIYCAWLAFVLGLSCGWIAPFVAEKFSQIKLVKLMLVCLILCLVLFIIIPIKWFVFVLLGFLGVVIGVATIIFTLQISHSADLQIQGEVMGTIWSIRTLGDAFVCLLGGALLMINVHLPFTLSILAVIMAILVYRKFTGERVYAS